jgi:F-type H+-transporting ATPase subunit b
MNDFFPVVLAAAEQGPAASPSDEILTESQTTPAEKSGGLSIQPTTVAFQALNFIVLVVLLHLILYKPIVKLLSEREKRIKEGVENAEKAEASLKESRLIREDMMKNAKVETQGMLEKARKEGENLKNAMVTEAQDQAKKIIQSGHQSIEMEKAKTMDELKTNAVHLVINATEKVLREKVDSAKDAKMIEESLNSYTA